MRPGCCSCKRLQSCRSLLPTPLSNLRDNRPAPRATIPRSRNPRKRKSPKTQIMDRHAAQRELEQYRIEEQPYYRPTGQEISLYEAAYAVRMPMMLKGPTGC